MFIIVQPVKNAPGGGPLYLEASFENPQRGRAPLVLCKSSLEADRLGVTLKTSPVIGMRDLEGYEVTVRVYADVKHTKLLGVHKQKMLYHDVDDLLRSLKPPEHRT